MALLLSKFYAFLRSKFHLDVHRPLNLPIGDKSGYINVVDVKEGNIFRRITDHLCGFEEKTTKYPGK